MSNLVKKADYVKHYRILWKRKKKAAKIRSGEVEIFVKTTDQRCNRQIIWKLLESNSSNTGIARK